MIIEIVDSRPKGYITVEECAAKNNCSRQIIQKRIKDNRIEHFSIKFGTRSQWWVKEDTVVVDERKLPRSKCSRRYKSLKEDYPFDLIRDIFGPDFQWEGTDDQKAGLEYAISTLTEREQICVKNRYQDKMTYKELSKALNVTVERVRQINGKIMRKFRNPNRKKYILNGYENETTQSHCGNIATDSDEKFDKYNLSEAFWSLNLSFRATNCFIRYNVTTVKGIVELIRSGNIVKIRNFGDKSYEEVVNKLEQYYGKSIYDILEGESA